jgi:hypothetical protein
MAAAPLYEKYRDVLQYSRSLSVSQVEQQGTGTNCFVDRWQSYNWYQESSQENKDGMNGGI